MTGFCIVTLSVPQYEKLILLFLSEPAAAASSLFGNGIIVRWVMDRCAWAFEWAMLMWCKVSGR